MAVYQIVVGTCSRCGMTHEFRSRPDEDLPDRLKNAPCPNCKEVVVRKRDGKILSKRLKAVATKTGKVFEMKISGDFRMKNYHAPPERTPGKERPSRKAGALKKIAAALRSLKDGSKKGGG